MDTASPNPPPPVLVLVVDDDAVNRLLASEMVKLLGYAVALASSATEAIAACVAEAPAVVLMDLSMPGVTGVQATRELRRRQAAGEMPRFAIVALTAHSGRAEEQECLAAGMDAYLTKPLLLAQLKAVLSRVAERPEAPP